MKIVNIDAPESLAHDVAGLDIPEFILEVLRPLEKKYYNPFSSVQINSAHPLPDTANPLPLSQIREFETVGYENIAVLVHTIPIYLRYSKPEENRNGIIDLLGAYYPKNDNPYIELFLSDIDVELVVSTIGISATNDDCHFKWLFTIALLHELAHAALDIFNLEHNHQLTEKVAYNTAFGKWREESMANAVALRIIKDYGDTEFYEYAKHFMQSQPKEYALGVLMESFGYWDFRSVFDAKLYGVAPSLQDEWLKYAKGDPDWAGLKKLNSDIINNNN